ncbi:uncharacterized protein TM35_000581230, partial [Trypanosoma theileri]
SRGAVEVSCGAGGALRVRPAAESEWLTCSAGSRVSACGKYADLCRQRTATTAATTTTRTAIIASSTPTPTTNAGLTTARRASGPWTWDDFLEQENHENKCKGSTGETTFVMGCSVWNPSGNPNPSKQAPSGSARAPDSTGKNAVVSGPGRPGSSGHEREGGSSELNTEAEVGAREVVRAESDNSPKDPSSERDSQRQTQESAAPSQGDEETSNNARDINTPGNSNPTEQSPAAAVPTATESSNENDTTSQPSPANTASEESTATPSRDSNLNQQSTATDDVTAAPNSHETNTTTPASPENNVTEAPTTTPSPVPVPNTEISSNIASTVQKNKANADSSVSPVWMRNAAPLLIVAMLFSVTMY